MSIRALNRVFENSEATGSDLLVLIMLANFANEHGKAWPSNATLARMARIDERHVRRCIATLHDELKEIDVSYKTGTRGVNEYHVLCFNVPPNPETPMKEGGDNMSPRTICPRGDNMPPGQYVPPNPETPMKEGGDNMPPGQTPAQMSPNPSGTLKEPSPDPVPCSAYAELPSKEEVQAEGAAYAGNLTIGAPAGIPEKWCRYWLASKLGYRQFNWGAWKLVLKMDFENDFKERRRNAMESLKKNAPLGDVTLDKSELREMLRVARHFNDEPEIARLTALLKGLE
jgi:hypothetical protein